METNPETRRVPANPLPVESIAEQRFNIKALIALGITLGVAMMAGGQRAQAATMTPHTKGATVITTKAHAPIATIAAKEKAPPKPVVDSGDTAWTLTSTALVLFMTIPGLSLFYGGLVRQKNVLSVLMHCFAMVALVTVMWTVFGYSMAFSSTGMQEGVVNANSFIGQLDKIMLSGVTEASVQGTIPELLWSAFQLTFAIITPALMIGAWAERFKFNAMMVFTALWMTAVYFPICHMVWAGTGSFLGDMGVLDFAGGIVVHITAGVGALIACILAGPRKENSMVAHNLPMTVMGTGMLWVGWYGFNAGSAITAGSAAAMAMVVTQLSASVAALVWMLLDVQQRGKVSALGMATGSIAGLAAITPASGFVGPLGGLVIGAAAGALCRFCSTTVKEHFGYDDSLDVFGVHGVGGFIGTILVGIFAHPSLGGNQVGLSIPNQLAVQAFAALLAIVYTVVASYALLKLTAAICGGLSVDSDGQSTGMDIMSFDEDAYVV